MKKVKSVEAKFIRAVDWIRQLGSESGAFEVLQNNRPRPDEGWDDIVTIAVAPDQRQIKLYIETRSQLSPQLAVAAFQKLRQHRPDGVFVLCAPFISPRVAELCRNEKVGYLDGSGNCWLTTTGLFINVEGRPNLQPTNNTTADPFSRKSSRIVRTLLTKPHTGWQVQQLSQASDVSIGLAFKVKNSLLEAAYVEERNKLLYLCDPEKLLRDWAKEYRPHVKSLQLFTMARPQETELKIGEWCRSHGVAYALTQLAGAWRYSPMVRYDKCVVYVDKDLEARTSLSDFFRQIEAKEVGTGANCTIWLTDDQAVFSDSREVDEVNVVSPLQLYLDLKQLAGRGEEAAEEIARKELPDLFTTRQKSISGETT